MRTSPHSGGQATAQQTSHRLAHRVGVNGSSPLSPGRPAGRWSGCSPDETGSNPATIGRSCLFALSRDLTTLRLPNPRDLLAKARWDLADRIENLEPSEWDLPTGCEGWRVRDVVGHGAHVPRGAKASRKRPIGSAPERVDSGPVLRSAQKRDAVFRLLVRQHGSLPRSELRERLREVAGRRVTNVGQRLFPGGEAGVALAEVVVHRDDMLHATGDELSVDPDVAVVVLRLSRRVDLLTPGWALRGRHHRRMRLVATDVKWSPGRGPEVRGSAFDLAAPLSIRDGVMERLSGAGVTRQVRWRSLIDLSLSASGGTAA